MAEAAKWLKEVKWLPLIFAALWGAFALSLYVVPLSAFEFHYWAIVASYVALVLPLAVVFVLRRRGTFDAWNRERGSSEYLRRELFHRVLREHPNDLKLVPNCDADKIKLLALKLEYFRRYQIQVQSDYFLLRGGEHRAAATWPERLFQAALIVTGLGLVAWLSMIPPHMMEQKPLWPWLFAWLYSLFSWLQVFGDRWMDKVVHGAALLVGLVYGSVFIRTLISNDARNAARYAQALENFRYLADKPLAEVRGVLQAAAAAPTPDTVDQAERAVAGYIERVHSIMAAEHAEWINLRDLDQGK